MTKPHERVSHAERETAARMLADATGAGYLTAEEFDGRVAAAYGAVTRADLDRVAAEIPPEWVRSWERSRRRAEKVVAQQASARKHLAAYLAGSGLMIFIWLAVGVATGAWYPWPLWPIIGWGFGVYHHTKPLRQARQLRNEGGLPPALGRGVF
ncbi:DUF1707 domain-containing protein [Asanoa sp. WMMD1127]|uniref:DUF1707 domain-containing protein n=1 Tax=Asanoa sp. WMMD1127 TaxID=3016107 RepID=UPI002416EC5A|nr:DUF1707 domain-containing protein [Asanoa sp. WMMD1127]MDG4821875.1 DUF1707 domain-containing protein [Asanoa sp. WMMD1127]